MKLIAVLNQKGGVGKTTCTMNLAAALAEQLGVVAVVDADPQGSASRWFAQRSLTPAFRVHAGDATHPAEFEAQLERLAVEVDYLLLDCPPGLDAPTATALLLADLVLIPCLPSPLDAWAVDAAIALARDARRVRGGTAPGVALVPSRVIVGTSLGRDLPVTLTAFGEPVLSAVSQRVAVAESAILGVTIGEYAPGSPAHSEFRRLAGEVIEQLKRSVG